MLLMIEKSILLVCHAIHWYTKANNKYMKNYDKNKESSHLKYWEVKNLYVWVISQKLPLGSFKWVEETPEFNEDFKKNCNNASDERYFLEVNVQYPENLYNLHNNLPFL